MMEGSGSVPRTSGSGRPKKNTDPDPQHCLVVLYVHAGDFCALYLIKCQPESISGFFKIKNKKTILN